MLRSIKFLIVCGVTVVVTLYVFNHPAFKIFVGKLGDVNFSILVLAFFSRFATDLVRNYRFSLLIGGIISASALFPITATLGLLNQILPLRIGEFSFPVMLRYKIGASLGRGAGIIFVVRLLDFLVVSFLGTVVVLFGWDAVDSQEPFVWALIAFCPLCLAIPLGPIWANKLSHSDLKILSRWKRAQEELKAFFEVGATLVAPRRLILVVLLTSLVWLLTSACCYLVIISFDGSASFAASLIAVAFMALSLALPLQGFAGIGVNLIAFSGGLKIFGYEWDNALALALIFQSFLLVSAIITVVFVFVYTIYRKYRYPHTRVY